MVGVGEANRHRRRQGVVLDDVAGPIEIPQSLEDQGRHRRLGEVGEAFRLHDVLRIAKGIGEADDGGDRPALGIDRRQPRARRSTDQDFTRGSRPPQEPVEKPAVGGLPRENPFQEREARREVIAVFPLPGPIEKLLLADPAGDGRREARLAGAPKIQILGKGIAGEVVGGAEHWDLFIVPEWAEESGRHKYALTP